MSKTFVVLCVLILSTTVLADYSESLLDEAIKKYSAKIPSLKQSINDKSVQIHSEIVNRIVGNGFTYFKQEAQISSLKGVSDSVLDKYIDHLENSIQLPTQYRKDFKETMSQIVWMDRNTWNVFNIMFSRGSGGSCRYVCIMARHDDTTQKTEWLTADITGSFKLADDVLIVRESKSILGGMFGSSQEKIKLVPHSITQDQLTVIFDFFQVVAFERFAELRHINLLSSPKLRKPHLLTLDFSAIAGGITSGLNLWQSAVSAFKTTKSETLKQIINGKGFSYFNQHSQVQRAIGIREDYFDRFVTNLEDRIQVPAQNKKDFKYALQDLAYMDSNTWVLNKILFKTGQNGNIRFVSIVGGRDTVSQKMNLLICDVTSDFKLADDMMIINKARSFAGGIYADEKDVIKKVPRDLTEEDVKAVSNFFFIVAFKNFADAVGIKLELPNMK